MLKYNKKIIYLPYAIFVFICINCFYGSIPFLSIPTLGQAVWTSGFAKSLSHNSFILDFFARDIGYPHPAAIAFGLSGAWVQSLFIRMGFEVSDAYSMMNIFWLAVAFVGCIKFTIKFNVPKPTQPILVAVWFSMPIVSQHLGYSMLALGIALLPTYIYAAICLAEVEIIKTKKVILLSTLYLLLTIISVFMDGYTFVMFACAASLILLSSILKSNSEWKSSTTKFFLHLSCFLVSYLLYISFIGKSNFTPSSEDYFRSWGLDLSFLIFPTMGKNWILDLIGYSTGRSEKLFFGDSSVWITTFSLPLILVGIYSFFKVKTQSKYAIPLLLVTLLSFYMAMGPSVKFDSTRTNSREEQAIAITDMPASSAVIPTGNAVLSKLPGFNAMRATYRWLALSLACLWLLLVIYAGTDKKNKNFIFLSCIILIALNLPNVNSTLSSKKSYKAMFDNINNELISKIANKTSDGERVVFLPIGNDFLINYVAPMANIKAFNIGGDKNLEEAKHYWPLEIRNFNELSDDRRVNTIENMLLKDEVDAVIIPYIDMLWSAHVWPCKAMPHDNQASDDSNDLSIDDYPADSQCPNYYREHYRPLVKLLSEHPNLIVSNDDLFTIIRLNNTYQDDTVREKYLSNHIQTYEYPLILNSEHSNVTFLMDGIWHNLESDQVWTGKDFGITLPVPDKCNREKCEVSFTMKAFSASVKNPYVMEISTQTAKGLMHKSVTILDNTMNDIIIPLSAKNTQRIEFSVPQATSPRKLGISDDNRILGMAVSEIKLVDDESRKNEITKIEKSLAPVNYPILVTSNDPKVKAILSGQWNDIEDDHVWSGRDFSLLLPADKSCIQQVCKLAITFSMFNASIEKPAKLTVHYINWSGEQIDRSITITDSGQQKLLISPMKSNFSKIDFHADSAESPFEAGLSNDSRTLGMALKEIDIEK